MAKKLSFTEGTENQDIILGIASDVRSWKLCYELNLILEIKLKNTSFYGQNSHNPPFSKAQEQLNLGISSFIEERFEDLESHPHTEYTLHTKDPQKLHVESKPFRFFLLIRRISATPPEADVMVRRLMKVDIIQSVVNFSDNKHLQSLLL